ncbi:methyltransferase domain protein [Leptospira interrogans str. 2003000735]|uniref:Methyltransferase domain protein n=4 Tax=Leptospira interrogans TaxID=173 RepID=A0A829D115_LEPIR|nr:class I SAM-dependent methyltransferase [Leptospira interrogans]EMF40959.1 methyltransferase domain protein [Leptospira interrogans serovar Lora str. TE 1992]EMY02635.1 methyltransferase domain protein [Leptospira interrogans str. 2002000626]EMY25147.1 methyltransferase domain protein [Leptospira interrogans serovar Australis str. 200703203]AKH77643.1 methyltransferase [Leptospira interrogans serovar Bratislava]EKN90539.1 methyltransferase domain protein [Leptospira interrogans str. 2002000
MENSETKESQYKFLVEMYKEKGPVKMSYRSSTMWRIDPKVLVFTLARHKFVAKMLSGYNRVLEVGCGDAFASRLLHPEVNELHGLDFDPLFIEEGKRNLDTDWGNITLAVHDILKSPYQVGGLFDAAFSLDVIEHIPKEKEELYLANISASIKPGGVFICGSPSLESQVYASPASKEGHINCKTGKDLKSLVSKYFEHTFLFGMNDEVLHTGFSPMSHYLFILATGNKKDISL